METDAGPGANPGYALGRLARALRTCGTHPDDATRTRAARNVETWAGVYEGLLSGALRVGSRTPVADTAVWATLEVAHGGFATGRLLAGGPLLPHERDRLARLPGVPAGAERAALNASYLTDDGLAELGGLLDSGCYRLAAPEEGALLAVAGLLRHGAVDAARAVLDAVGPYFPRLRFYPAPGPAPAESAAGVHLQTVGDTARQLAARRVPRAVLTQREAIRVWGPLHDRVIGLFLETVDGPPPALRRDAAGAPLRVEERFVVDGGWPCQHYPAGWADRAAAVLTDYGRLRADHKLCGKPDRAKRAFARLRGYLNVCAGDPRRLTGRDVGFVRLLLAGAAGRAGADRRRGQEAQAAAPAVAEFAPVVLARLAAYPADGPLDSIEAAAAAVTPDEAARYGVPGGRAVPDPIRAAVWRAVAAEIPVLVAAGVVPSGEVLARVVPQHTARVRAAGSADPALRRLDRALYAAFRRRRSLLLLNLASQVKLAELPWAAALDGLRAAGDDRGPARQTLGEVATLVLAAFPEQLLPNKLLQEIRSLAAAAGLELPVVDEVAADIFMGTFSEKFVRAARVAAGLLAGGLYERYYGLPYDQVTAINDVAPSRFGTPASPAFARLCAELAGADAAGRGAVARNGTVIEQEQILTTHNLAVLFATPGLVDALRPRLRELAERVFGWVCRTLRRERAGWKPRLRAVKNAAYAWRQMVFFLSLLPAEEATSFLAWAEEHLTRLPGPFRDRFRPTLEGLIRATRGLPTEDAADPGRARRFLGWTTGRHWLLDGIGA